MPNRITYESRCTSASLAAVSSDAEVLFDRLTTKADDFGRYDARVAVIRGACFSLKLSYWTESRVSSALDELEREDIIRKYDKTGRGYLYFPTWDQYQRSRASTSKFPDPPSSADIRTRPHASADIRGSRNVHVHVQDLVVGSKSKEAAFEEFYAAYPRHVGSRKASEAFVQALKRAAASEIIAGAQRLASDVNLPDAKFIPHPSTWLNRDGWHDDPLPSPNGNNGAARTLAIARRLEEQGR